MEHRTLICIGRQFGSGGRRTAQALKEKLGIEVYDNELITKAAEHSGYSEEFFRKRDEKTSLLTLQSFFGGLNQYSAGKSFLNDNALFNIQSDTIRSIASQGDAIFVGRASDYVLRDMDRLSVFISAPMEVRVKNVCEREGLSASEAENLIRKNDRIRETYYNYVTFGNWGVAANYDLCIDSSVLGIDGTADTIIEFGKRKGIIK